MAKQRFWDRVLLALPPRWLAWLPRSVRQARFGATVRRDGAAVVLARIFRAAGVAVERRDA